MSEFSQVQHQFSAHLKDPENNAYDDAEERRMTIYRELFFNNIVSFLDSSFPVLASLYERENWLRLARRFFAQHHCRSPYFVDISKEFVEFVAEEYQLESDDPIFLPALAHYEWLELDVSIRKGRFPDNAGKSLCENTQLRISPLASLVSYCYPVHQISADFQPDAPTDDVFIIVYRDALDNVEFILVNQVTAFLINIIEQFEAQDHEHQGVQYDELLNELQTALPDFSPEQLSSALDDILADFSDKGIVSLD
ncbi:HvfC family RiPP maturation protein [Alteromonas oceanisediminis]|uniref:HvfC family RiPP maturation protein n=1 Tax=Alteromonas oceanisediminis TaxID=2836180 RepID=UPI001BDB5471|nr:putative DNA-binding domain-containing protein [Alteromonas oceanisediminis]MBT0587498.1 putative DNA-binding domain-containing protein [Alteromonas oceanisediminis]